MLFSQICFAQEKYSYRVFIKNRLKSGGEENYRNLCEALNVTFPMKLGVESHRKKIRFKAYCVINTWHPPRR